MLKRRLIWLLIGAGLLVAVLVVGCHQEPPEPEYGGKKLSEWLDQPNKETITAIRQIGTNAVPYLITWIRYEMPAWKIRSYETLDRLWPRPPAFWYMRDRKQHRASVSVYAFDILGSEARSAIPALSQIMNDPRSKLSTARNAAQALRMLNAGSEFVAGLTNRLDLARGFVGGFCPDARSVLQRLQQDESRSVRDAAGVALRGLYIEESKRKRAD